MYKYMCSSDSGMCDFHPCSFFFSGLTSNCHNCKHKDFALFNQITSGKKAGSMWALGTLVKSTHLVH